MNTDKYVETIFNYKQTLFFLITLGCSFLLWNFGIGAWIFLLDIPEAYWAYKEIKKRHLK